MPKEYHVPLYDLYSQLYASIKEKSREEFEQILKEESLEIKLKAIDDACVARGIDMNARVNSIEAIAEDMVSKVVAPEEAARAARADAKRRELILLEEECEKYERAIASLDLSKGGGGQNGKEREEEGAKKKKQERLEELELELERAFERDKAIELEVEKLELELEKQKVRKRALQRNAARVKKAEFEIWHEANQFEIDAKSLKEERDALETKLERASTQLDLLRRTNVYNDAFHIWHDGPFGTINGFRLGRTSTVPVEWDEINAAWGMATLLLQSLANAMKIEFRSHALRPMGSFPAVCEINANTNTVSQCYDLFGPVNIMTSHKYDRAICGFLACLDELGRYFAERDFEMGVEPVFRYPYSIEADKVDGKKVTFTFNRDEKWTAALKLVLTDLKMAVSYVASRNG